MLEVSSLPILYSEELKGYKHRTANRDQDCHGLRSPSSRQACWISLFTVEAAGIRTVHQWGLRLRVVTNILNNSGGKSELRPFIHLSNKYFLSNYCASY